MSYTNFNKSHVNVCVVKFCGCFSLFTSLLVQGAELGCPAQNARGHGSGLPASLSRTDGSGGDHQEVHPIHGEGTHVFRTKFVYIYIYI